MNNEPKCGDFIAKVLALDESSSEAQLNECLLYDVKRLACLAERSAEVFIDKCAGAGLDISLAYEEPSEGLAAVKNWLRYKIAADKRLHAVPFDGDKTPPVLEAFGLLLRSVSAEAVFTGDRRFCVKLTKDAPPIELETDTVNSLATTFSRLLKEILTADGVEADYAANYRAAFGLSGRAYDRALLYAYCLARLDDWYQSPRLTDEGRRLFDLFIRLAERSHVLGNFTLVPAGYNVGRYPRSKDYWDLTLRDLKNFYLYISNFGIFDSFEEKAEPDCALPAMGGEVFRLMGGHDFALYGGHSFAAPLPEREDLAECLANMTRLIEVRGLNMLGRLNGRLKSNAAFAEMKERAARPLTR